MIKSDISSLYLTFCHEFFMESRWVFSYDLENSCYCQKTTQNTPIHCESFSMQICFEFRKILGFIAWPPHIIQRSVVTRCMRRSIHIFFEFPFENFHLPQCGKFPLEPLKSQFFAPAVFQNFRRGRAAEKKTMDQ